MNKYNVRAVRHELEDCIRHGKWTRFRHRFASLSSSELKQAVVAAEPRRARKKSRRTTESSSSSSNNASLVHALCHAVGVRHHHLSSVPLDILESVLQSCDPRVLHNNNNNTATPLSIALDRGASPAVIECLLCHDTTKASLFPHKKSDEETPLLKAIKRQASVSVVRLLIQHDATKKSLLVPSRKRHRVPLYYMAHQELDDRRCRFSSWDEIPSELVYMLLQTQQALQLQQKGRKVDEHILNRYDNNEGDNDVEGSAASPIQILRAIIDCAHFLGDKYTSRLLSPLLVSTDAHASGVFEIADHVDGNTLLHKVCQAAHAFLEPMVILAADDSDNEKAINLLDYLISKQPAALLEFNAKGELPLHAALCHQKPWKVLERMINGALQSVRIPTKPGGQLPLHLAIQHYRGVDQNVVSELWKRHPQAAATRDGSTRLFAFQLAALPDNNGRTQEDTSKAAKSEMLPLPRRTSTNKSPCIRSSSKLKEPNISTAPSPETTTDHVQLSRIFFLLRAAPEAILGTSRDSSSTKNKWN